ncbi:MAG: SWIM zinc finger family protein [Thermoplasmata archaeon]
MPREGRPSGPPLTETGLKADRRSRALTEALEVRPDRDGLCVGAEVRNPTRKSRHHVYLPGYPGAEGALCTCPDFVLRALGTCKHVEAALLYFEENPGPSVADPGIEAGRLWSRVDAARAAAPVEGEPDSIRWRRPGRILVEASPHRAKRNVSH